MSDQMTIVMASYPSIQLAERDYGVFKTMDKEDSLPVMDLAVVRKDELGKVGVVHELHHPVRKGLVVGAVLGIVAGPVGLAAGAVGGAAGGKLVGLFEKGVGKHTMKDLGDFLQNNSVMLVVVAEPNMAEVIGSTLNDATGIVTKTIDVGSGAVTEALSE